MKENTMKRSRVISVILSLAMLFSLATPAFATTTDEPTVNITSTGIYIDDEFYTKTEFRALLDEAIELPGAQPCSAVAGAVAGAGSLIAGTWWVPGVGEVVITTAGVILVAGVIVEAGSWIIDTVTEWFETRAEIAAAKEKIPSRLKGDDGEVDLSNFDQKVPGKNAKKEKGGWTIEKDTAGHGGSKWKLKDKQGNRVASLDENGKVLRG